MSASPLQRSVREIADPPRAPRLPIDPLILLAAVGLVAASLVGIYAASHTDFPDDPYFYVKRQALFCGVGLVLMLVLWRVDYSRLRELKYGIYVVLVGSILLVTAVAGATRGTRAWLDVGFVRIQPSELGKVLLILALSAFVVDRLRRLRERETTSRIMLLALAPTIIVMAQPDLGTAIVYVFIALAILFVAGAPWPHFAGLATLVATAVVIVLVVAPAAGVEVLKPYQVDRLTAFLHPSDDPGDEGYHQAQSKIAIGSGEKTGRGVEDASQSRLNFLPEDHTDFVFSAIGETYGFVGAALILSLYALLVWRTLRILTLAKNLYGALIAGGIAAMLMFQIFQNIGMTVGIMPITGVPLPLLSYGGSSALATFIALGLLQSIYAQGRVTGMQKSRGFAF